MPLNPLADPNCPYCHGEGFNFTGEAFAPTQGDRCDCLRRGRAQRYAKMRLVAARIPPKFAGASIDGFHIRHESIVVYDEDRGEAMQRNLGVFDKANRDAMAELCAKPLPPGLTVFLKGPNGVGKTFLANALSRAR